MGKKDTNKLGPAHNRHGVNRNPQAKVLQRALFRNRILPNKKKDVKPGATDE
jgi:hypothetical protein